MGPRWEGSQQRETLQDLPCAQLHRRGFFPKGGGRAELTVHSLEPGASLQAFNLTDQGDVTGITISAFQAGLMKPDVAQRMASAAEATLQKVISPYCPIEAFMMHSGSWMRRRSILNGSLTCQFMHRSNETSPHPCAALAASSGAAQKHITGIQRAGSGQWCGHITDSRHLSGVHLGGFCAPREWPAS